MNGYAGQFRKYNDAVGYRISFESPVGPENRSLLILCIFLDDG